MLNPDPSSATFASFSTEFYYNATLLNQTTNISTNYNKLEASAKLKLPPAAYDYAAGGAGLETTIAANRAAFDKVSTHTHSYITSQNANQSISGPSYLG
ncbi:hypothetical protein IMZ48_21865 [Candidatus Bathyarchaeota archaeon]|nr:hypothetical protein [Candidatus Bathyarchaeota archaeon]